MNVIIEASARHVHLSSEDMMKLFGYILPKVRDLSQPGQFVCDGRITIVGEKGKIENVAVLGPCRSKTQVEISITDSFKLGINPVIRESGDLEETPGCKLLGPKGEVLLNSGVIVAKRHIHMHTDDAKVLEAKNGDIVKVEVKSRERSLIFDDVVVRVSDKFSLAMHIDTDEANAIGYKYGLEGKILM